MKAPEFNLLFVNLNENQVTAIKQDQQTIGGEIYAYYEKDPNASNPMMPIRITIIGEVDRVWYVASELQARIIIMTLFLTSQHDNYE